MLASSHGYFGHNLSPRKIVPNVEVETINMSSSPVHTKSYVFRPQKIWPPALFTNLYTKYYKCLQAITNMSSSQVHTLYFISSPLHQYIHYVFQVSAGHNKYVLQSSRFKVLCLQATTNISSSPVHTRYCVCSPQQICLLGWRTYLLWPADARLCITGLEDIFVVACSHNTLYILGWRTYLLWPADTIPCIY